MKTNRKIIKKVSVKKLHCKHKTVQAILENKLETVWVSHVEVWEAPGGDFVDETEHRYIICGLPGFKVKPMELAQKRSRKASLFLTESTVLFPE